MSSIKLRYFILLTFCFLGCKTDSFYKGYRVDDVWRIPLIKPYELRNSLDPSEESYQGRGWSLSFISPILSGRGLEIRQINVSKINVQDSIIFGYGAVNPGYPFIIDSKNFKEMLFEKKEDWIDKLDSLNIKSTNLKDIQPLFEHFKSEQSLPWNHN